MATLLKFFQKQSLPMSNEVELLDAVRREVNSAVQKVLEEERNKAGICEAVDKPESDSESEYDPSLILMNSRDSVKLIDLDCACVLPHYLNRHLYFND